MYLIHLLTSPSKNKSVAPPIPTAELIKLSASSRRANAAAYTSASSSTNGCGNSVGLLACDHGTSPTASTNPIRI